MSKIIKQTTVVLNETPTRPKERKPVDIWCDGETHQAMVIIDNHYEFGGSEKCDCKLEENI